MTIDAAWEMPIQVCQKQAKPEGLSSGNRALPGTGRSGVSQTGAIRLEARTEALKLDNANEKGRKRRAHLGERVRHGGVEMVRFAFAAQVQHHLGALSGLGQLLADFQWRPVVADPGGRHGSQINVRLNAKSQLLDPNA